MIAAQKNTAETVLDPAAMEMIRRIARRIRWRHGHEVPEADLVSFGVVGYLESQCRHDSSRVPLLGFAYRRVYGAMLDGVRHWSHKRRVVFAFQRKNKLLECRGSLDETGRSRRYGTALYADEIGEFSYSVDESQAAPWQGTFDGETVTPYGNPEEVVDRCRRDVHLRKVLAMLPKKDRILLEQSFYSDMTLQEIGASAGLSRSWTCRRHQRALAVLEALLREHAPHVLADAESEKPRRR